MGDKAWTRLIIEYKGKPIGFDARSKIIRADPENSTLAR